MRRYLLRNIRLFGVLLICVFAFSCLQAYVYRQSAEQIRAETVATQVSTMAQGASVIDKQFEQFWEIKAAYLQKIDPLKKLMNARTLDARNYAQLLQTQKEMCAQLGAEEEDNPVFILCTTGKGYAVTQYGIYDDLALAITQGNLRFGGMTLETLGEWLDANSSSSRTVTRAAMLSFSREAYSVQLRREQPYLCVVQKLSPSYSRNDVYLLWMYRAEGLYERLSGGREMTPFLALRHRSELLYTTRESAPIEKCVGTSFYYDEKLGETFFCVNFSFGLQAFLSLSDKVILAQISRFTVLYNVLICLFIVLAVLFVLMLVFYFVRPVDHLYKRIVHGEPEEETEEEAPEHDIFTQMEMRIERLSENHIELQRQLTAWRTMVHRSTLRKLLRGERITPGEAEAMASMPGVCSERTFFVVLIGLLTPGTTANERLKAAMDAQIKALLTVPLFVWMDDAHGALILSEDFYDDEAFCGENGRQRLLRALFDGVAQELEIPDSLAFGVGQEWIGINRVSKSYQEACLAFREAELWQRSAILHFDASSANSGHYCVSYESLTKLQTLLGSGTANEAFLQLDTMLSRLTEDKRLIDEKTRRQFYNEIYGVILRVAEQQHEPSILVSFPAYSEFVTMPSWMEKVRVSFQYIAEIVQRGGDDGNTFSESLLNYIRQYYSDPAMSLSTVAEAFSMSERSLSRFFRDKLQDTFSNMLEKIRLSEAEKLLREDRSLQDVADSVGYANVSTFTKAFKRRYGATPTEWGRQNR